ncbi:ATP-dependent DNA helicase [Trichonephila clavipes]|nr:ATP-dependent DNA helicase [Trichonephila clavipes]
MYVDDWITGQDTREEALFMSRHAKNIMKEAGMEIRKWISNDTVLMAQWAAEGFDTHPMDASIRFLFNIRNPTNKKTGPLTSDEMKEAEIYLMKQVQLSSFYKEIRAMQNGDDICNKMEPSLLQCESNRLNIWQRITKSVQTIWKRWSLSYLNSLQQRKKWIVNKENLKLGDMVLIREENLPPCKWLLGRVVKIYMGKDKKVRVVDIKTGKVGKTWSVILLNLVTLTNKVQLPEIETPPEPLNGLLIGMDPDSNVFLKSIRRFNSCFQMTSFGATEIIRNTNANGQEFNSTFKIRGQVYHKMGSLLPMPNEPHKYLQIYFMGGEDSGSALANRVNARCDYNNLDSLFMPGASSAS